MKKCLKCKKEFSDKAVSFCPYCGSKLLDEAAILKMQAEEREKEQAEEQRAREEEKRRREDALLREKLEALKEECAALKKEIMSKISPMVASDVLPPVLRSPEDFIYGYGSDTARYYERWSKVQLELKKYADIIVWHRAYTQKKMYDDLMAQSQEVEALYNEVFALNRKATSGGFATFDKSILIRQIEPQVYLCQTVKAYFRGGPFETFRREESGSMSSGYHRKYTITTSFAARARKEVLGEPKVAGVNYLFMQMELGSLQYNLTENKKELEACTKENWDNHYTHYKITVLDIINEPKFKQLQKYVNWVV